MDSSEDRLVLFIPGGDSGLGCVAMFWNGFMLMFTFGTMAAAGRDWEWWGIV